ncbi:MAG: hypothetical protein F4058_04700 [Rhodothermaceae bacterium]|nr:hypothetical protein [Rhodothermaceae bacterium]MYI84620.1 hypothetical protein [Rhodothermaceae bacterium]
MNEKLRNLVPSLVFPLLSFSGYWRSLDDAYSASNLLWGGLVTLILAVSLYLFLEKKPERFSVAWGVGISVGVGLIIVGLVWSSSESSSDIYRAWGDYMWFFGLWTAVIILSMPKEHKPYKWSFFKRVRPEEGVGGSARDRCLAKCEEENSQPLNWREKMNERIRSLIPSLVFPLLSFWRYWRSLDDAYSASNLLWGALVTIILAASLYLFLEKKPERFSVAWGVGMSVGFGLFIVGSVWSSSESSSDIYGAWGDYMRFFGLFTAGISVSMPKEHKPYKWSFFKRVKPEEDVSG